MSNAPDKKLIAERDGLVAKLAKAEKQLAALRQWKADRLAKDAASDAVRRHGGELNAALLTPHVLSAVRFTDVDEDRPTINIVDPDTGNVRPALHSTSSCGSYGFRQISAICLAMLPSNSSAQS